MGKRWQPEDRGKTRLGACVLCCEAMCAVVVCCGKYLAILQHIQTHACWLPQEFARESTHTPLTRVILHASLCGSQHA